MPARFLSLIILTVLINGCVLFSSQLHTLRKAGASQKEIAKYIKEQNKLFEKLLVKVKDNSLEDGMSRDEFIKAYGDPVLSESITPNAGNRHACSILLYRHQTEYFTSDRVYAYFDGQDKLVYWEYKPRY